LEEDAEYAVEWGTEVAYSALLGGGIHSQLTRGEGKAPSCLVGKALFDGGCARSSHKKWRSTW